MLALMALESLLFVLPGFAIALLLHRRRALDGLRFTCVVFTASAAIGYLFFWIYFASVTSGQIASFAVPVAAVAVSASGFKRMRSSKLWRDFAMCFTLVLLTGWFYFGLGYLYKSGDSVESQVSERILPWRLPADPMLPYLFADRIYRAQPLRPYLFAEYKTSDRPPLQAGIALEQFPLWNSLPRETHYHLLAVFLQCQWIGAAWVFLRFAGIRPRLTVAVLALCVFTGFFFLHSFFVWPKLLGAALFLFGVALSPFSRPDFVWTLRDGVLAGIAVTLGLLSHAGTVLVAPGIAWVIYRSGNLPGRRIAAWTAGTAVALFLPWMLYQKLYDPPGDFLLKAHIAGSLDQQRGFGELLIAAYRKLTAADLFRNKYENFRVLFLVPFDDFRHIFSGPVKERYEVFMRGNFFCLFQALGLLNLGLILRPALRWFPPAEPLRREMAVADRCAVAALTSTAIWCLIMFGPAAAVIHQGSMAIPLLLFIAFGLYIAARSWRLAWIVVTLQATLVFPIFVFGRPLLGNSGNGWVAGPLDPGFAVAAVIALAGLVWWGRRAALLPAMLQHPMAETPSAPAKRTLGKRKR